MVSYRVYGGAARGYRFFEKREGFGVPEEAGHVDEEFLEEELNLIGMLVDNGRTYRYPRRYGRLFAVVCGG